MADLPKASVLTIQLAVMVAKPTQEKKKVKAGYTPAFAKGWDLIWGKPKNDPSLN